LSLSNSRAGMTLIEALVALVIIGTAVASARSIADQIAAAGRASATALDAQLASVARDKELRRMFALAIAPTDSTEAFDGAIDNAAISTRCFDVRGFEGSCRCNITVTHDDLHGDALERSCGIGLLPDTLATDSLGLRILYLVDAAGGGRWIPEWRRTNSLPRAIGVVRTSSADTLIVRVGERG
jgi:prepilin-type N-terminal cleavage/methylation domain-containing protein